MIINFIYINYHWNLNKQISVEYLYLLLNLWSYMRTREEFWWFAHNMVSFTRHHPVYNLFIDQS